MIESKKIHVAIAHGENALKLIEPGVPERLFLVKYLIFAYEKNHDYQMALKKVNDAIEIYYKSEALPATKKNIEFKLNLKKKFEEMLIKEVCCIWR